MMSREEDLGCFIHWLGGAVFEKKNEQRMGRLAGKVAIVTGCGSGIGLESSILFAKEGAKVVACDGKYRSLKPLNFG